MNHNLINRYIRGETTTRENLKVLSWLEENPENEQILQAMHRVYDAALLSEDIKIESKPVRKAFRPRIRHIAYSFMAGAAAVSLVFMILGLTKDGDERSMNDLVAIQTYSTMPGEQLDVLLPDGSKVWLNANSCLQLMAEEGKSFADNTERVVKITGEAYFDVARDEEHPFRVSTEDIDVTVLGTRFDVSDYGTKTAVVIESGSVRVSDKTKGDATTIAPGQMYVFDSNTGMKELHNVNISDYLSWKDGYLAFDATPLSTVFEQMENFYSVAFLFSGQCRKTRISGKLDLRQGLEGAMSSLNMLVPLDWHKTTNGDLIVQTK